MDIGGVDIRAIDPVESTSRALIEVLRELGDEEAERMQSVVIGDGREKGEGLFALSRALDAYADDLEPRKPSHAGAVRLIVVAYAVMAEWQHKTPNTHDFMYVMALSSAAVACVRRLDPNAPPAPGVAAVIQQDRVESSPSVVPGPKKGPLS